MLSISKEDINITLLYNFLFLIENLKKTMKNIIRKFKDKFDKNTLKVGLEPPQSKENYLFFMGGYTTTILKFFI